MAFIKRLTFVLIILFLKSALVQASKMQGQQAVDNNVVRTFHCSDILAVTLTLQFNKSLSGTTHPFLHLVFRTQLIFTRQHGLFYFHVYSVCQT